MAVVAAAVALGAAGLLEAAAGAVLAVPESASAQSVENARSCLRRLEADALRDAA